MSISIRYFVDALLFAVVIFSCYESSVGKRLNANIDLNILSRSQRDTPVATPRAQTPFTFEDIFNSSLRPRGFDGSWVSGEDWFTFRDNFHRNLMLYNAATDEKTLLMENTTFSTVGTGTYYVSPDLKFVLLPYNIQSQWRYSYSAQYKIYNVETKLLSDFPAGSLQSSRLQYAGWASRGNALSFVYENNLYVQSSPSSSDFVKLTDDGDAKYIFNGIADWLYEEDVLGDYKTHYWSPNNSSLCYATFNVTEVPLMTWPLYETKEQIYPKVVEVAYPKPGDVRNNQPGPNTKVTLTCVTDVFNTASKVHIDPPAAWQLEDHYYTSLSWRDDENILVAWTNRVQNHIKVHLCNATSGVCELHYERIVANGWVQAPWPTPHYIDNGANYISYLPKQEGSDYFNHVAHVSAQTGNSGTILYLTEGTTEEVVDIVGYDENKKLVYYIATNGDPTERHLFRVGTPFAAEADKPIVCITCSDYCRVSSASFSSSTLYYLYVCSGPSIYTYWLRDVAGTKNVSLESNQDVAARYAEKAMPTRHYVDIPMAGGYVAKAEYYLPPGYTEGQKYPLLIYGYGGPDSQQVIKSFDAGSTRKNWLRYLGSSENVVVASLDGRGASYRGENFRFEMYRRLGTVEIEDHIEGARYFLSQSYIDSTLNPAIFGWSYGGFTTSHALANSANVFKCGLAVAPVTSYRYYDTAYTERYMGLATDNSAGYDATDVMSKVSLFKGKKYLLVHGTADDNVHFQHSAQLVNALTENEIQFRLMMYVDENHGIPYSSRHLYRLMSDALVKDCWPEPAAPPASSSATYLSVSHAYFLCLVAMIYLLSC